jgi:hypothetical protein
MWDKTRETLSHLTSIALLQAINRLAAVNQQWDLP